MQVALLDVFAFRIDYFGVFDWREVPKKVILDEKRQKAEEHEDADDGAGNVIQNKNRSVLGRKNRKETYNENICRGVRGSGSEMVVHLLAGRTLNPIGLSILLVAAASSLMSQVDGTQTPWALPRLKSRSLLALSLTDR